MDDSAAERRKCGKDGNVFLRCSPVTYLRTSCLGRWEMGGGRQVGLNLEVERWKEGMCSWSCLGLPGPSGQVRSSGRIQIQIQVRLGRYGSWHVWVEWKQALSLQLGNRRKGSTAAGAAREESGTLAARVLVCTVL